MNQMLSTFCAGPTAFMLGNEGYGMTPRQIALCDKLVYISQYGGWSDAPCDGLATNSSKLLHNYLYSIACSGSFILEVKVILLKCL